ncbi:porin family protein [Foetidibacter luteolus]|uniref:porin family protein n=1 Tax=Foetidibacter luteolus TaxID=2608880 RepID=UPI00129A13F2|nr:porin family protein [Foetidibacter luteolus]
MRKTISLLALVLSLSVASAQKLPIQFGLKAGVNLSNVRLSEGGMSLSLSSITGFHGGAFVEIPAGVSFFVQPELIYNMLGAKLGEGFEGENGIDLSNVKLKTDYISVPVLAKYKIPLTGLGIYAGPQYSFLASAKGSLEGGESGSTKELYKSGEFAGVVGAEYFFKKVGIIARYQFGFSNIFKEAEGEGSMKNNAFAISLGFKL